MKTNLRTIKMLLTIATAFMNHESFAVSSTIRISQVYGGGGNSGAIYQNDFVELFNASSSPVNITGWSIQYAAATSSLWHATSLSGVINAGGYYLIQLASEGAVGLALPTPDATGTTNLSATDGKVALVNNGTTISADCPTDSSIIDLVGYGTTADCFEGAGAAPTASNTESIVRGNNGCMDSGDNSVDFTKENPDPHNSSSSANLCSSTGINDLVNHATINVWSSPNHIYVDFTNVKTVNAKIEILDLLGQSLSNEKFSGNGIYCKEISNIEFAFIIVRITNDVEVVSKKLINVRRN